MGTLFFCKIVQIGQAVNGYHFNSTWDFPKIRATLFWGPYNKDPTIKGTILGSPIFGNPASYCTLCRMLLLQRGGMGTGWNSMQPEANRRRTIHGGIALRASGAFAFMVTGSRFLI